MAYRRQPLRRNLLLGALLVLGLSDTCRAGEPLSALPSRGPLQASDQLPVLPAGAPQLQSTSAGAILGYVRGYPAGIYCDGVHDDTVALQAAIDSGVSFDLPPGVCVTSASLSVRSSANDGQAIRGAGAPAASGGAGKTTIRPTAAVTAAVIIDGSPFGGYIEGFSIEGVGLDMLQMGTGAKGFSQLQAYDVHYARVRVFNDSGKTSWNFGPGAYTTSLDDVQGGLVYCLGNGVDNPTTITLVNPDINGLNVEQCANVTTIGGAIQPAFSASNTIVYLPPGTAPLGFGPNAAGMYLALGSYLANAQYFSSVGTDWEAEAVPPHTCETTGWTFGTYADASHGCLPIVMAVQVGGGVHNVNFVDPTFGSLYLYNPGGSSDNLTVTGYQSGGGQGNYHLGADTYQSSVFLDNSQALFGYSGLRSAGGINTFLLDASNGAARFDGGLTTTAAYISGPINGRSLSISPITSGANFAAIGQFGCYAASIPSASSCFMGSGAKFIGLQDPAGTVGSFTLDASTGRLIAGSGVCPGAGTDANPTQTGVTCLVSGNGNPLPALGVNGWFYFRGDCVHGSSGCIWHKENGLWYDLN